MTCERKGYEVATLAPESPRISRIDFEAMCRRFPHPLPDVHYLVFLSTMKLPVRPYCPLGMLNMVLAGIQNAGKAPHWMRYPAQLDAADSLKKANPRLTSTQAISFAGRIIDVNKKIGSQNALLILREALEA